MPTFKIKVVTDAGEVVERTVEAEKKFDLYDAAEEKNEMLLSAKEVKEKFDLNEWINFNRTVSIQEVENFTSQLSVVLQSGVPLIGGLQALEEQTQSPKMRKVVAALIQRVNEGESFSKALSHFPNVFSLLYVNMVKAGETAGILGEILQRLSQFIRHDIELTRNIKSALRYPTIVLSVMALAFVGAMVFVVPKFHKLFLSKNMEMPLPTQIMLTTSNFMVENWLVVTFFVLMTFVGLKYFKKTPIGAYQFDMLKLHLPVFSDLVKKSVLSRFVHMLETLMRGGIQIVKALEITQLTVGNLVVSKQIDDIKNRIMEGSSLADAMQKQSHFPKMTVKMVAIGEKSGALENMLLHIGRQYDDEVDTAIARLSSSIEPIITLVMGGFLLILALGILLPIWNMYSVVK